VTLPAGVQSRAVPTEPPICCALLTLAEQIGRFPISGRPESQPGLNLSTWAVKTTRLLGSPARSGDLRVPTPTAPCLRLPADADATGELRGSDPRGRTMRSHLTPTAYQLNGIAVLHNHRGMAKRKTTLYIDDDVMTATKATATAMHSTDSAFVEDALRAYLKTSRAEAARVDLRAVLDRLAAQNPDDLTDEEAMELAVEEVRAVRSERRSRK
jgi:hypothetical protein